MVKLLLRYGSTRFLILILMMTVSTSLVYVGLVKTAFETLHDYSYMKQCAIGFSGINNLILCMIELVKNYFY